MPPSLALLMRGRGQSSSEGGGSSVPTVVARQVISQPVVARTRPAQQQLGPQNKRARVTDEIKGALIAWQNEYASVESEAIKLEARLSDKAAQLTDLTCQYNDQMASNGSLEGNLEAKKGQLMRVITRYNDLNEAVKGVLDRDADLERYNEMVRADVAALQIKVDRKKAVLRRMRAMLRAVSAVHSHCEEHETRIAQLSHQLAEASAKEEFLRNSSDQLTTSLAEAHKLNSDTRERLAAEDDDIAKLGSSHQDLEARLAQLREEASQRETDGAAAKENARLELADLHAALAKAQEERVAAEESKTVAEAQLGIALADKTAREEALNGARAEVAGMVEQVEAKGDELSKLKQLMEATNGAIAAVNADRIRLEEEDFRNLRAHAAALTEFSRLTRENGKKVLTLRDRRAQLAAEVEERRRLQQVIGTQSEAVATADATIQQLAAGLEELKLQSAQAEEENAKLLVQAQSQKEADEHAHKQLRDLQESSAAQSEARLVKLSEQEALVAEARAKREAGETECQTIKDEAAAFDAMAPASLALNLEEFAQVEARVQAAMESDMTIIQARDHAHELEQNLELCKTQGERRLKEHHENCLSQLVPLRAELTTAVQEVNSLKLERKAVREQQAARANEEAVAARRAAELAAERAEKLKAAAEADDSDAPSESESDGDQVEIVEPAPAHSQPIPADDITDDHAIEPASPAREAPSPVREPPSPERSPSPPPAPREKHRPTVSFQPGVAAGGSKTPKSSKDYGRKSSGGLSEVKNRAASSSSTPARQYGGANSSSSSSVLSHNRRDEPTSVSAAASSSKSSASSSKAQKSKTPKKSEKSATKTPKTEKHQRSDDPPITTHRIPDADTTTTYATKKKKVVATSSTTSKSSAGARSSVLSPRASSTAATARKSKTSPRGSSTAWGDDFDDIFNF